MILFLCLCMGIIVASIMQSSTTESRLNERAFMAMQARNAVESIVDYATAHLVRRWDFQTSFKTDELAPSNKPVTMKSELTSFLAKTAKVDLTSYELIGGIIPPAIQFYVNPNDPANQYDSQKGKIVTAREISLFGMVKAKHKVMGEETVYAMQTLQLRDAPLFSHAIFYNMDLEFHPGPDMTISGPVHSNGNIWAVSKANLWFTSTVTATGQFRVSMARKQYQGNWSGMSGESDQDGDQVWVKNISGNYKNPYTGSGPRNQESSYYTSVSAPSVFQSAGFSSWRDFSINRWSGNVQTGEHDVPKLLPTGYPDYVGDEDGKTEVKNGAHAIIEPNLKLTNAYHKGAGENEKFARKAGLIAKVHYSEDGATVKVPYWDAPTKTMKSRSLPAGSNTSLPSNAIRLRSRPDRNNGWSSAKDDTVNAPTTYNTNYYVSFYSVKRTDPTEPNSDPVLNTQTVTVPTKDGGTEEVVVSEVIEEPITPAAGFDSTGSAATVDGKRLAFDRMLAAHPYVEKKVGTTQEVASGMRDWRVALGGGTTDDAESRLNLIEINTAALADVVENYTASDHQIFSNYNMPNQYSGVVYVEFPDDPSFTPRSDKVLKSVDNAGLLVTQGGGSNPSLGRVPNPDFNKNKENRDAGFTLVTNNSMYVRGHFNADGTIPNGQTAEAYMKPDKDSDPNPPVALAADAITILSGAFKLEKTKTNAKPNATSTEVCAAIVSGLQPTNKGGKQVSSGGSHNFPRFLETWGSTFRYRGSLVALFESEVHNQTWSTSYYSPPTRQWAFYNQFGLGNYPPGTPNVRCYRKIDFRYLTINEYKSLVAKIPWDTQTKVH